MMMTHITELIGDESLLSFDGYTTQDTAISESLIIWPKCVNMT